MSDTIRYGASVEEWNHFSAVLKLTADMLPVVSNPYLTISPQSKMKTLGKTPSILNKEGLVVGLSEWTTKITNEVQIERWKRNQHYGICMQTRNVRGIDVDIPDADLANRIHFFIIEHLGLALPKRYRIGSSKFLLAVRCPGDRPKDVIATSGGPIEMLGTGQQFVCAGAHIEKDGESRSRYLWQGGLPSTIPEVSPEVFDALVVVLREEFGTSSIVPLNTKSTLSKSQHLHQAVEADPVAQHLLSEGEWVKSQDRDGKLHIVCPFEAEHDTGAGADSSTSYFPAMTGGYAQGHFVCLHAHCQERSDDEFKVAIGFEDSMFDDLDADGETVEVHLDEKGEAVEVKKKTKYEFVPAHEFSSSRTLRWLIKNVLPQAELAVLYGQSTAGKTFIALSLAGAIAQGKPWRGFKTTKMRVAFVVAEGISGFRNRLRAYAMGEGISLAELDIVVLADVPNLSDRKDASEVMRALKAAGPIGLVIIDTYAKTTHGADENNAKDVTATLENCRLISKHTGAMVMPIQHAGKDLSKGARGSTVVRAAADVEIEIAQIGRAHV